MNVQLLCRLHNTSVIFNPSLQCPDKFCIILPIVCIHSIDFSPMEEEAKEFTDRENRMLQYVSLNGIFERSHILMGFENALCACMEDPEEYGRMLEAFADHKIRLFQKVYDMLRSIAAVVSRTLFLPGFPVDLTDGTVLCLAITWQK